MTSVPNVRCVYELGSADVYLDDRYVGYVSHRPGSRGGWFSYDVKGRRIDDYPSPRRDQAITEVVNTAKAGA